VVLRAPLASVRPSVLPSASARIVAAPAESVREQRQLRPPVGAVVLEADGAAALRDRGQPIGVVPGVGSRGLPRDTHRGAPSGGVNRVAHRTLRRGLGDQIVQAVVAARDRAGDARLG